MIKAKFRSDDGALSMQVSGHANTGPKGKDLICASGSILAYTAAQDVKDMHDAGRLKDKPKIKLQNGRTIIEARPADDEAFAELLHTLFIVQKGFMLLAANYPKAVSVSPFTIE